MPESKPAKPKEDPSTKVILVLDDDEAVRHLVQATLEVEGFRVVTGRDGTNIVQTALRHRPHLIVSDLMMPHGGGFELIRALQSDPETAKLPVILISGRTMDDSTRNLLKQESNVIAFIPKPLRPAQFTAKIHEILNTVSKEEKMMKDRNKLNDLDKERFEGLF